MPDSPATIRRAVDADADLLPAIERAAAAVFRDVPELAWVADDDVLSSTQHRAFIARGWCWVAEAGQAVGFVTADRAAADVHVWELAVQPAWQRQGIGRRLLESVIRRARAERCTRVTLTTFTGVAWNEPYYRGLGFERLDAEELDDRLRRVLELEVRAGMPAGRRCAMRLDLR